MATYLLLAVMAAASPGAVLAELSVSVDFEGGSAVVDAIDPERRAIHVRPGGDSARGWPCWWYLRIDGLGKDEEATLVVRGSDRHVRNNGRDTGKPLASSWALPGRAACSVDGVTWLQTDPGERTGEQVSYRVVGHGGPLWVAWGPPFTLRQSDELLADATNRSPAVARAFDLARSREDRPVRGLRVGPPGTQRVPAVWIQARQHAWESGSSWVARGFVEWLVAEDPDAAWLREHAEVFVIPVMDVDRVATGDGGKEAEPHDHNRDWSETPFYPEIAAAQRRLLSLAAEDRLAVFLDLHNPSPGDQQPFFFVPPADHLGNTARANQDRFLAHAARRLDAPLALAVAPRVTGSSYHPLWRRISGVWVSEHAAADTVAACLETAWNTPHSTTAGYRGVGAKLGLTVTDYLRARSDREPASAAR